MLANHSHTSSTRRYTLLAIKLGVSVGLLAILFSRLDTARLWASARQASIVWLALALGIYLVNVLAGVWRWQLLLRAQDVVQGALQDLGASQKLKLDANVVATVSTSVVATGSSANQLPQLFDMEKAVVFQLLQKLGITLSAAEQRAISERPTADLQAFLSFSQGLEAEDHGDYQAAANAYQAATQRDPNFKAAREKYGTAEQLSLGVSIVPSVLAGLGSQGGPSGGMGVGPRGVVAVRPSGPGDLLRSLVGGTVPSSGLTLDQSTRSDPPGVRPTLPEATRQDIITNPTGGLTGTIIIIINRP